MKVHGAGGRFVERNIAAEWSDEPVWGVGMRFGQKPRYVGPSKPVIPDVEILAAWERLGNVGKIAAELDTSVLKVKQSLRRRGVAFKFHVRPRPTGPTTFRCPECERIGHSPTCPWCQALIAPALIKSSEIDLNIAHRSLAGTTRGNRGNARR